ncbi:DUF2490 domain-containing protein [Maribellus comscasis]|uniref:DUF2490 domain-containing protein n=1 Tax=Maribellus comscasis TaxID=2681766 RepID=A0A6I6JYI1_9BACT|nr:DUF2490 domain-containing protein [Maribellus comscasis]QGY46228.1 DUF2490 domain-containing protein [Maribellus comscasis]
MKRVFITILMVAFVANVFAQRTWFEFEISKDLTKKLELSFAPEIRFKEKFELNEYLFQPGLEYKFSDYFSLGGKYRLGNNLKNNGDSQWYGRFAFDAKTNYEWEKLETQLRLRYTNSDDFSDDDNNKTNYLRVRLKMEYALKKLALKPYAAYEIYRDMDDSEFDKGRWEAGLEYKINKHHRIGTYFRINDYFSDKESVKILGFTYKLTL